MTAMDRLETAFCEDPFYVYFALALAELVLAGIWYEKRTRRWAATLLVPVVLAGAVVLVEKLVVTDREWLVRAAGEIAADFEAGKVDAAEKYLDEKLMGFFGVKQATLAAGRAALLKYDLQSVRLTKLEVQVDDERAKMHTVSIITFKGEEFSGRTSLIWDVHWLKRDDGWRIIRVDRPREGIEF